MTMGTPDFNTALQMMADWLVWLDEKEAELNAKIAKAGGSGAAATSAPPGAGGASLSTGAAPAAQAGGRVLPFSPFDEDAPADLPIVVPVANPGWLPPAEPKPVAGRMLDVSDTPDPLGEDDDPSFARWKGGDTPDPLAEDEDDDSSPGQILDDPFKDDELVDADSIGIPLGVASRPSGARAAETDAGENDAEDFRQAMRPGQARPVVINQAPAPRLPLAIKPPIPAPRPSSPVVRGAADLPMLAVEPATDPLDALETPWGANAAPGLAKRKRRTLQPLRQS